MCGSLFVSVFSAHGELLPGYPLDYKKLNSHVLTDYYEANDTADDATTRRIQIIGH